MVDTPTGGLEITIHGSNRDQKFAPDITRQGQLPGGVAPSDETGAGGNDAGVDYLVQSQARQANDTLARAREKYGVPLPGAAAPSLPQPGTSAEPAAAAPSAEQVGEGSGARATTDSPPAADLPIDKATGLPIQGEAAAVPAANEPGSAARAAGKVGGEIVRAPRAAVAGVAAAGKELFHASDELATWLNTHVADLTIPVRKTGSETVDQLLANPAKAIADAIPQPDTPDNTTGPVIKSVSQFLAGMLGGGKLLKEAGLALSGAKKGLAAGAVADALFFDPKEENLAALLKHVPALDGPVTAFLATNPDDNDAVNRLRRAVEGLGLGIATDAVIAGLRAYRAQRAALKPETDAGKVALDEQKRKFGELNAEDLAKATGGDAGPDAKIVSLVTKELPDAKAIAEGADDLVKRAETLAEPKPAKGDLPGGRIAINWARIASGDDVKVALRDMADHFKTEIGKARRGKITQEETAKLADDLGMSVDDLLARREGQALNAEETLAARRLLTMASEKLLEAARVAGGPNAGAVDLFAFRRMVATHAAIQNEVLAARAEAGRALAAWKIPATAAGDVERSRAIAEALSAAGGDNMARDLARRMMILADSGAGEGAIAQVAQKGWGAATWDAVAEVWVNGLLSSPKTHLVNVASNTMVLAQQILERGIASRLNALTGGTTGVAPGEAMAMAAAIIQAQKDAWRASWLALKSGETGHALGKVDLPPGRGLSADAFRIENDAAAKTVDFLGTVFRTPSRLLGAEDEFFKAIGYRMELNAQAVRQATSEGLEGKALRERIASLVKDPPENIHLQATDAALYQTFTSRAGDAADALLKLREAWPATMYMLPFVRTPINILHYGFERTPLAPLMSSFRADMAAGGARAELATVRMATGTTIMLLAADYADRGVITGQGPKDAGRREALMRQGWQPYSIRVGDKWVAFDRADPYGLLFGFAADMAEYTKRMDIDDDKLDEFSEIFAAGITAIAATTVNKTYLRGLADLVWTVEDPQRKAFGYVGSTMGSFVPAGVALMKSIDDPVLKENFKAWDYVRGRVAGWSEGMLPARDLWGKERQPDSGMGTWFDAVSPARASTIKASPVDAEMQRLDMNVERIDKKTPIAGVPMNFRDWPEVYDRYVQLAGNLLKDPVTHKGAKDYLDELVQGRGPEGGFYKQSGDGPSGGKADMIGAVIRRYRLQAQAAILADPAFTAFQGAWREQKDVLQERNRKLTDVHPPATPDVPRPMPPGAPPATISPMRVP